MCGIFGIGIHPDSALNTSDIHRLMNRLFLLSESRGKDSAGFVIMDDELIQVYKRPERARRMIRSTQYKAFTRAYLERIQANSTGILAMGHTRMVTNGRNEFHGNNQPVIRDGLICIHNGIIVNDMALWESHPDLIRQNETDTEVLLALTRQKINQSKTFSDSLIKSLQETQGANSIALIAEDQNAIILATTNGSLYYTLASDARSLMFASEEYILQQVIKHRAAEGHFHSSSVLKIHPYEGFAVDFVDFQPRFFDLRKPNNISLDTTVPPRLIQDIKPEGFVVPAGHQSYLSKLSDPDKYPVNNAFINDIHDTVKELKRCTRCILPETFPFIEFDSEGVCNYCHTYTPVPNHGVEKLAEIIAPYRRSDGKPDVLVPISGGRDSSYGLHYIKNELGLNPISFTYDWGLVTDLARRNISRMCGQLGVEHILISADITAKRENVKRNVLAWLKNPNLGTVPLFMAGDKQFFYYSMMLSKQMDIGITLYNMNPLERTDFKVGFCGINEVGHKEEKHYSLSLLNSLRMMGYYGWHFLINPSYINRSLLDSMSAFISYYLIPKDYYILFDYIRWDEKKIDDILINQYDWETADDTASTWRIGDGTASFYNYIYYVGSGFSENDTLRSNQVREGMLERSDALRLAERDNQPRYSSMRWYAETIGFSFEEAINTINKMPKLYSLR